MQPGEIVTLGRHRLMCGDSTNPEQVAALMDGEQAQMLFTDPPYGVDYVGGRLNAVQRRRLAGDRDTSIYGQFLPHVLRHVDGPCYLWFAAALGGPVYEAVRVSGGVISALIVWHKTNATYAALGAHYKLRHEVALYCRPKRSTMRWVGPANERTVWEVKRDARNTYHPTQKPVALAERALRNHSSETVLDVFGGSGSTLIAAENTGRRCFMMELDPTYCQTIIRRYEAHVESRSEAA